MDLPVRIQDEFSEYSRIINQCEEYRKQHNEPSCIVKYEYIDDDKKWVGYKWYDYTFWVQLDKKQKTPSYKEYINELFWYYVNNGHPYLEQYEWDDYYKGYWLICYWENNEHLYIWWG